MNILVDIMTHIGDVLLCTPAFKRIKELHPGCRIIALIRPYTREVVQYNQLVDEYIEFDVKSKKTGFLKMFGIIKLLRNKKIDRAYLFDGKLRGALLSKLAGIPIIIGPVRDDRHKYAAWFINQKRFLTDQAMHKALYYLKIVDPECRQVGQLTMSEPSRQEQAKIDNMLASVSFQNDDKLICLCTRGTFPLKNWPQEYFAELIKEITKSYRAKIIIVGAAGDRDYVDEVIKMTGNKAYNFADKTNLRELWYLLSKADLFVTVDTGAMHIGSTTKAPMIAIFGCTTPRIYGPVREDKAVALYTGYQCSPCTKKPHECTSLNCLKDISVQKVFALSRKMLEDGKAEVKINGN